MRNCEKNKGFGAAEIVVAATIISVAFASLFAVFLTANRLNTHSGNKIEADFLAEEGLEALRFLRDYSWSENLEGLSAGPDYYLAFSTSTSAWSINSSTLEIIGGVFERKFAVESVERNANDDITQSGGTTDPDTKKFNLEVSWNERGATSTVLLSTYLSDVWDN